MVYGMSDILSLHLKEVVRVKVKKHDERGRVEYHKFTIEPQLTSFEGLRNLLAEKSKTSREFSVCYQATRNGRDDYIPLTSEWDLDFAISEFSSPSLRLKMEMKPLEKGLEDWDIIAPADIPPNISVAERRHTFSGAIATCVEKSKHILQRAFSLDGTRRFHLERNFMTSSEYHSYLDSDGRMALPIEFRRCVYRGGVEPKMRREVWKHILNVYPEELTKRQQVAYIHRKRNEYLHLRDMWQTALKSESTPPEELNALINLVRKDVRRTDRAYKFFAGSDDNKNVTSLFNILTTYGVNHPSVAYCQGMSDLLSPILVTMKDEPEAYICFCALMERTKSNFSFDGHSIKKKFRHLGLLLEHYDPEFSDYLRDHEADHFFFCYRWLVLEMKREFPYEEALHVLEVMWSSLPPNPPQGELPLFEDKRAFPSTYLNNLPVSKSLSIVTEKGSEFINNSSKLSWKEDHFTCSDDISACSKNRAASNTPRKRSSPSFTDEDDPEEETLNQRFCNSCQIQNITSCKSLSCGDLQCYCQSSSPKSRYLQQETMYRSWAYSGRRCKRIWPPLEPINFNNNELIDDINSWCLTSTVDQKRANYKAQFSRWESRRKQSHSAEEDEKMSSSYVEGTVITSSADGQRQRHGSNDSAVACNSDDSISVDSNFRMVDSEFGKRNSPPSSSSRSRSEGYSSLDCHSSKEASSVKGMTVQSEVDDEDLYCETTFTSKEEEEDQHSELDDEGLYSETMLSESGRYFIQPHKNKKLERITYLPPPHKLGDGNPFLLFLCLTVLLQHRNVIMRRGMDCNEMAMHFEKMVRKHRAHPVLEHAREMFRQYLQLGWQERSFESCKIIEA